MPADHVRRWNAKFSQESSAGPSSELTADPLRLRVVDLEIIAEEIFHRDLLLLR